MDIVNEYKKLNSIATQQGVVVFGEGNDVNIPVSELKQSFNLDCAVYNRSFRFLPRFSVFRQSFCCRWKLRLPGSVC